MFEDLSRIIDHQLYLATQHCLNQVGNRRANQQQASHASRSRSRSRSRSSISRRSGSVGAGAGSESSAGGSSNAAGLGQGGCMWDATRPTPVPASSEATSLSRLPQSPPPAIHDSPPPPPRPSREAPSTSPLWGTEYPDRRRMSHDSYMAAVENFFRTTSSKDRSRLVRNGEDDGLAGGKGGSRDGACGGGGGGGGDDGGRAGGLDYTFGLGKGVLRRGLQRSPRHRGTTPPPPVPSPSAKEEEEEEEEKEDIYGVSPPRSGNPSQTNAGQVNPSQGRASQLHKLLVQDKASASSSPGGNPSQCRRRSPWNTNISTIGANSNGATTHPPSPPPTCRPTHRDHNSLLQAITSITLTTKHLPKLIQFYKDIFDALFEKEDSTTASFIVNDGSLLINLVNASVARDKLEIIGDWGYTNQDQDIHGNVVMLSAQVEDVHLVHMRLQELISQKVLPIVIVPPPQTRHRPGGGSDTVTFLDPAGHCWEVWQKVKA